MSGKPRIDATEVRRLSQEEGLIDKEIAERLSCHRVTITRIRSANNIPRPNLLNRKDKVQVCKECGKTELIRRSIRIRRYCYDCQLLKNEERRVRDRESVRQRQK